MKCATERPATMKTGPDDTSCVVWAVGEFLKKSLSWFFYANYYVGHKCPSFLSSYSCLLIQTTLRQNVK
jgi:hypothetical protein